MQWSRFMVFEDYIHKVIAHFDKVHPHDLRSRKSSLLSRDNKKNYYKHNQMTFITWWAPVCQQLNSFNNTPEEFTAFEKLLFLVNNTGHVPWFESLTVGYTKLNSQTIIDFDKVKSQYENIDVTHWSFHPRPTQQLNMSVIDSSPLPLESESESQSESASASESESQASGSESASESESESESESQFDSGSESKSESESEPIAKDNSKKRRITFRDD